MRMRIGREIWRMMSFCKLLDEVLFAFMQNGNGEV